MIDVARSFWFTKPKLKGKVAEIRIDSSPHEVAAGGCLGYVLAFASVVNTRPEKTTVASWDLEVEFPDGSLHKLRSAPKPEYWDSLREECRPSNLDALEGRRVVFEQNIGVSGWLYFPFDLEDCTVKALIATDARGTEHRICVCDIPQLIAVA